MRRCLMAKLGRGTRKEGWKRRMKQGQKRICQRPRAEGLGERLSAQPRTRSRTVCKCSTILLLQGGLDVLFVSMLGPGPSDAEPEA